MGRQHITIISLTSASVVINVLRECVDDVPQALC